MSLSIYTSRVTDGSMKPLDKADVEGVRQRRYAFFRGHGIDPENATFVRLEYEGDDYCRYMTVGDEYRGDGVTRPSSIIVDGLVTTQPGHALFLPLADCIAAVLHDPTKNVLMVSHLGRHNLEQNGGHESVRYLVKNHGVSPENLTVWLSPAAGPGNYPLHAFNNRSLHEVAAEQLASAGVLAKNIEVSPIDTTTNPNYFSHSEFLKGNRETDGRFSVTAVM